MINAKILYDFMVKFKLTTEDIIVKSDGIGIWFEKPSGERWPLEYSIFKDGSYDIEIFKDESDESEEADGEHILLETGVLGEDINEENIQSNVENA